MIRTKVFLFTLAFTILLLSSQAQALSYQEGIHFIRPDSQYISTNYPTPEFLTVEDLTFVSCLEEDIPLRNSLLCLDDNSFEDLETTLWATSDNCYISSYNLENFECDRLLVQAEYTSGGENLRMTKLIRVNKLSKVLDKVVETQYTDGGWRDSLSTAYGVWVLSFFKDIYSYEIELGLDWLKRNRNDELKCWPRSPCNVQMSSNILALLTLSDYTDARRVVNDARNWFEQLQNSYKQGDTWSVDIYAPSNFTILSLVAYEQDIFDENFTLPYREIKTYTFSAHEDSEFIIISDDNIIANISNQLGDVLLTYQGDNLTYTVPGACWSLNRKGEACHDTTSMFALMTPINDEQAEQARIWARGQVERGPVLGRYFGDYNNIIDTALYLYNVYEKDHTLSYMDELINYLLYRQNNEGSWGTGTVSQKAEPTAYAALSLVNSRFNRSSEPVKDAEEWISNNEDDIDLNNTIALASAFYILKHNARPLLTSEPKIVYLDSPSLELRLFNPTTFNLQDLSYEFSDNIKDYVDIDVKDEIQSYSYRRFTVSRISQAKEDIFGFLEVKNLDDPVALIPIVLTDTPTLEITVPEAVTVFGRTGQIPVRLEKSAHDFICTVQWDSSEIFTPGSITIRSDLINIPIQFSSILTREDLYRADMTCKAAGKDITKSFNIYVRRFADTPLYFEPTDLLVADTTTDVNIFLKNNLDRDLSIKVSMDRYANHFRFRDTILLSPNQEYNLTIFNELPTDINLTSSVLIELEVLNRTEIISMLIDIYEQEPEEVDVLLLLLPYLVIAVILTIISYFAWKFRDILLAELNKLTIWKVKAQKREESQKIRQIKTEETQQAIANLYNILKLQDKDDKDIAQKLLSKFERDEIKAALASVGAALADIDEEEPEKL